MRNVHVTCDRCRESIEACASVLELVAGDIRRDGAERIDLCPGCVAGFRTWLRGPGRLQEGPHERNDELDDRGPGESTTGRKDAECKARTH